jgi:hypothetical protein
VVELEVGEVAQAVRVLIHETLQRADGPDGRMIALMRIGLRERGVGQQLCLAVLRGSRSALKDMQIKD